MTTSSLSESDKKELGRTIGNDLARCHGKKKYYAQPEIKKSLETNGYVIDVHCWAYCLFMNHGDFDDYHNSIGEVCDYLSMKSSMISSLTDHASDSWLDFDFNLSWFEWPDIDISSIFDSVDIS